MTVECSFALVSLTLLGTMKPQGGRIQPFTLVMDSFGSSLLVRCVSPIGVVDLDAMREEIASSVASSRVRLGAVPERDESSYNRTVEESVLLSDAEHDPARINALLKRVAEGADRLEFRHLPGEDRRFEVFRADLVREGVNRS